MFKSHVFALVLLMPLTAALAQLPHHGSMDSLGKRPSFQPYLGRIAIFNELIGPGMSHTLNVQAFPLKLDAVGLGIRVGTTTVTGSNSPSSWKRFAMVYSVDVEVGRRRSRFIGGAGVNTKYALPYGSNTWGVTKGRVTIDWFTSIGYRFQMPWGFFFGLNAYLVFHENNERDCILCTGDYAGPKVNPSFQVGFRPPSSAQHRWYRQLTKATPEVRNSLKPPHRQQRADALIPDSLRVPGTGGSEVGGTILGSALLNLHYTYLAQLGPKSVAHWYVRPGIGTVGPTLQFQLETGMAFLWNNTGFTIGGGGNGTVGIGWEAFIVTRGKVALKKGLSASLGVSLIWSEEAPFFTYVPERSGRGWVMPSVGLAYRWPKRRR